MKETLYYKGHECKMNGKWKEMKTHQGKQMQHERQWKDMKGKNDICWLSTKDAFTPTGKIT